MEGNARNHSAPAPQKIQIPKDPGLFSCFAKIYFPVSREMLNICYSHDRSGDRVTRAVAALPGACHHPRDLPGFLKTQSRGGWGSKYVLQTQGHARRLGQPSSAWKISLQVYVKYTSAHAEGLTTVGQFRKSRGNFIPTVLGQGGKNALPKLQWPQAFLVEELNRQKCIRLSKHEHI